MRSHRDWPLLQIWSRQRDLKAWVNAKNLRVARLEPMVIKNSPSAVLDLRFVHQNVGVSVMCCIVDVKALEMRTQDALVWPFAVAHTSKDEDLYEIEAMLVNWLRAAYAGTGFGNELVRRFGDGDQSFEAARHTRLLGAVCYSQVAQELAAGHYAARYVAGKQVLCVNTLPNVSALLAPSATRSAITNLDRGACAVLNEWFGAEFLAGFAESNPANVVIVSGDDTKLGTQIAADTRVIDVCGTLSGDVISVAPSRGLDDLVRLCERGEVAISTRSVARPSRPHSLLGSAPVPVGGSYGRILLVLREDGMRGPGSDTDEAHALRGLLTAEGFTVDVTVRPDLYDPAEYDVIHGFGLLSAQATFEFFTRAERAGVPTVLTPFFEDIADGGTWGARAMRTLLDMADDEQGTQRVLELLAGRNVYVDDVSAHQRFDNGDEAARKALLRSAKLVITHSRPERDAIEHYAQRSELLAISLPLVYRDHPRVSVAHLVPDQAYMFVHAGVEARHNVGLVLYAASALDIPCVFAGPILDRRLYRHIAARLSTNIVMVPECTASEQAAMLESAAVYLDAAWIGDGSARIVKSLLHGVVPVVTERRFLDVAIEPHVVRIDPASFDSIRNGISEAWQRAGTDIAANASRAIRSTYDPDAVFKATISAYVAASALRGDVVTA